MGDITDVRGPESGGCVPATVLKFLSIIDLASQGWASLDFHPGRALHAHH
jgi:hypothetical protein